MGFISREKSSELMSNCESGTFLLRFKASEIEDTQSAHNKAILAPSLVFGTNGKRQWLHRPPGGNVQFIKKVQS